MSFFLLLFLFLLLESFFFFDPPAFPSQDTRFIVGSEVLMSDWSKKGCCCYCC